MKRVVDKSNHRLHFQKALSRQKCKIYAMKLISFRIKLVNFCSANNYL